MSSLDPFNPDGRITHGGWNFNHTTSIAIVFPKGQLITPWPWLTASLGLSVLIALWGVISVPSLSAIRFVISRALAAFGVIINTVRAVALVVLFAEISRTGYVPSSAGIAVFLLSCLATYTNNYTWILLGPLFKVVLMLDVLVVFVLLTLRNFLGFQIDYFWYGRWILYGGTCPQPSKCDNSHPPAAVDFVGCAPGLNPFNGTNAGSSNLNTGNPITDADFGISLLANIIAAMFLGYFAFRVLRKGIHVAARPRHKSLWGTTLHEHIHYLFWGPFHPSKRTTRKELRRRFRKASVGLGWIVLFFMLVIAGVSLTLNIIYQRRPTYITYMDSFGPYTTREQALSADPPVNLDPVTNTTAWTDCFRVEAPFNKLGYWDVWASSKRTTGARFVAIV